MKSSVVRQSNFELLRIIAMLMVLSVHSNFISIGIPSYSDFNLAPMSSFVRLLFEATSIICVNLFVLVSGWFGLNSYKKSFCNILFQAFFTSLLTTLLMNVSNLNNEANVLQVLNSSLKWNWFIYSYLFLMLISPLVNKYIESIKQRELEKFLLVFFVMQTVLDLSGFVDFYAKGYSPVYLLGIYILGRYLRLFTPKFSKLSGTCDLIIYLLCVVAIASFSTILIIMRTGITGYAYTNPIIVVSSVFLFLFFSKLSIKPNKLINFLGASSFSVLIVHTNKSFFPLFHSINNYIFKSYSGILVPIFIFIFILFVFLFSVLLDQIRKFLWNKFILTRFPSIK